jgi:hypothetical protein
MTRPPPAMPGGARRHQLANPGSDNNPESRFWRSALEERLASLRAASPARHGATSSDTSRASGRQR